MARFDVYTSPDSTGYLLDVQADLLENLNTRIVVPLIPLDAAPTPAKRLNPIFDIRSGRYVMVTQFLSAVPASLLKTPVLNLASCDSDIMQALDLALTGI
ncbi:plasmid maintenance protein CcdB [Phaeobacter inhibens]|uniref:CcdB family protein n=1 Tax=Phaeobacter inhibens TaxID=221822 RepID=UPI0027521AFF|nr:CcdB family protein [Phaeobacter inhibens]GLO72816.1 plasmid maintenance protein CcdB [Phaeobacter inhibens]